MASSKDRIPQRLCIKDLLDLTPISTCESQTTSQETSRTNDNSIDTGPKAKVITIRLPPTEWEFTNTHPPWRAPGSKGIYGGVLIGQSLAAAQRTLPDDMTVHSLHSYFLQPAIYNVPLHYVVAKLSKGGRSFERREVKVYQREEDGVRLVYAAIVSFVRDSGQEGGRGRADIGVPVARHSTPLPVNVVVPSPPGASAGQSEIQGGQRMDSPEEALESILVPGSSTPDRPLHHQRVYYWIRSRDPIAHPAGHPLHVQALAFLSDRFFFGVVARTHRLHRYHHEDNGGTKRNNTSGTGENETDDVDDDNDDAGPLRAIYSAAELEAFKRSRRVHDFATAPTVTDGSKATVNTKGDYEHETRTGTEMEIDVMTSLDHAMYFHDLTHFRADEWLLMELETPWADRSRGVAVQRLYTSTGELVATCVQEGLLRLRRASTATRL